MTLAPVPPAPPTPAQVKQQLQIQISSLIKILNSLNMLLDANVVDATMQAAIDSQIALITKQVAAIQTTNSLPGTLPLVL